MHRHCVFMHKSRPLDLCVIVNALLYSFALAIVVLVDAPRQRPCIYAWSNIPLRVPACAVYVRRNHNPPTGHGVLHPPHAIVGKGRDPANRPPSPSQLPARDLNGRADPSI